MEIAAARATRAPSGGFSVSCASAQDSQVQPVACTRRHAAPQARDGCLRAATAQTTSPSHGNGRTGNPSRNVSGCTMAYSSSLVTWQLRCARVARLTFQLSCDARCCLAAVHEGSHDCSLVWMARGGGHASQRNEPSAMVSECSQGRLCKPFPCSCASAASASWWDWQHAVCCCCLQLNAVRHLQDYSKVACSCCVRCQLLWRSWHSLRLAQPQVTSRSQQSIMCE